MACLDRHETTQLLEEHGQREFPFLLELRQAETSQSMTPVFGTFYEFFAGAGMARAGLGKKWQCLFANDFDRKKVEAYGANWGDEILCCDVRDVTPKHLPNHADLVWASFPCQDLSLAGNGAGLQGERSGTFWPFWNLMTEMNEQKRGADMVVIENVCGMLTSHEGKDFTAICEALQKDGYQFGALVIDAALFVPQSRPRLFIVAVRKNIDIPKAIISDRPYGEKFHTRTLKTAYCALPAPLRKSWIWWRVDEPLPRSIGLSDLIEVDTASVTWHTPAETQKLLNMMDRVNLQKVHDAQLRKRRAIGTVYKRTRCDETGCKVQRAEIRFDDIAGCLRTPAGGSSRQLILIVEGKKISSRLISIREAARLMGLPDDYILPNKYNEAYHLIGDGVVVSVVRFLAQELLEPIFRNISEARAVA